MIKHGENITYGCLDSYTIEGSSAQICDNGRLTNVVPKCKGLYRFIFENVLSKHLRDFVGYKTLKNIWWKKMLSKCLQYSTKILVKLENWQNL